MGAGSNGHSPNGVNGTGARARAAQAPAKLDDDTALAVAERPTIELVEGAVVPMTGGSEPAFYRLGAKDLQRIEALKQRILTHPGESFADQVWFALAKSHRINPADPWVRNECGGKRPSDAKLMRFLVSVLRRAAPEMLVVVRAQATAVVGSMVNEALEVIHRHATTPIAQPFASGAAVNLKAAAMLVRLAGLQPEGAGTEVDVHVTQKQAQAAGGSGGVTEEALRQIEAARAQLYDRLEGGEAEGSFAAE